MHDDISQVSEPQEDERRYSSIRPLRRRFANRVYQTNPYINEVGTNMFWRTQLGSLHEVEILEVLPVTLTHAHLSYKAKNGQDVAFSTARHDDLYLPMGNTFQDPQGFYTTDPVDGRARVANTLAHPDIKPEDLARFDAFNTNTFNIRHVISAISKEDNHIKSDDVLDTYQEMV